MLNTLIGTKKGMTSTYDARGRRVGATIIELGPNYVTQVKTTEGKDGYNAVQLGFSTKKSVRKPQIGHFKKVGIEERLRFLREARVDSTEGIEAGKEIKAEEIFQKGDAVKVTGVSKGKGFQGGVRRHGFHGGPKTHGQSDRHRAPGSIGTGTTPGRVLKGKKMAGHMGMDTVSLLTLEVIAVDRVNHLVTIKGGVPGPVGGLLIVENMGKIKGYTPPPEEKPDEESDSAEASSDKEDAEKAEEAVASTEQNQEGEQENAS